MKTFYLTAICGFLIVSSPNLVRAQVPIPGQPYQIPAGYEGATVGSVIGYGGASYITQGDGTMRLAQQTVEDPADTGPLAGQPYQVPAGDESYGASTLIAYGGANYTIQGDGTMLLAQQFVETWAGVGPVAGQPYQVPAGYESYGAGTLIAYGGTNYTIQGDGTMLLAHQFVETSASVGPVAGQPYQVPAGYEGYGAGTLISYGGANYIIQGDGTMLLAQQTVDTTASVEPVAGQPYQVPAGYEGYGAGTLISYGGANYIIQGDGTMLLAQQRVDS